MIFYLALALTLTHSFSAFDCYNGKTISYSNQPMCTFYFNHDIFFFCDKLRSGVDHSWGSCYAYCCDQLAPEQASCQSLAGCQDNWDKLSVKVHSLTLGFAIGGSIAICLILLFCFCNGCPLRRCFEKRRWCRQGNQNLNKMQTQVPNIIKESRVKVSLLEGIMDYNISSRKNDICPICLDDCPNLMFECSHFYHKKCGAEMIIRKKQCSLCRCTQIKTFRLYCSRCFCRYTVVTQLALEEEDICIDCSRYERYETLNSLMRKESL